MATLPTGKVWIVGAGPGSLDYLTLQAYHCLQQAEVLIYDALSDPRLLDWVPADCETLAVGKRGGQPSIAQEEINQLLVTYCQRGKTVVRLKGGDPFIFGRCREEMQALREAGCPFAVIPGLSAALVAPLLAGIPLTDTVLSQSFAVATAHDLSRLNWSALAAIDTLVFLMGGRHLAAIVAELQRQGRSPTTPIALIRWAGRPEQQIWVGTLADIVDQTQGQSLAPVVIVIGEVVRWQGYFATGAIAPVPNAVARWDKPISVFSPSAKLAAVTHSSLPLNQTTILVTRSANQSREFTDLLQAVGATVLEMPTLVIKPPSSWAALDAAIAQLETFNWLLLTSANGVDAFFERLAVAGRDARALAGVKLAVVGKKTARTLQRYGLQPDFMPPEFVADALVGHFPEPVVGQQMLFPRVESGGRDVLVKELTQAGAIVTEVAAYESGCPDQVDPAILAALNRGEIDVITFASSKTVKHFAQLVGLAATAPAAITPAWLAKVAIAAIGPQTSQTCKHLLGRVDIEAREYTLEGLVQAILRWQSSPHGD
ncbi:uroporphyrinogen-III C-methyltransferase [Trichothermofontia sp.]